MNRKNPNSQGKTLRKRRRRARRILPVLLLCINAAGAAAAISLRSAALLACAGYGLLAGAALWAQAAKNAGRERRLRAQLTAAKAGQRESARLLAGFSHELRTPLQSILGYAALGRMNPEEAERCLREIGTAGMHLLSLAGDGLTAGRLAEGGAAVREVFDLERMTDECRTMVAAQLLRKGQVFRQETDYAGRTEVTGDVRGLRQILVNLLGNAVKYTPEGGVIRLIVHRMAADGLTEWIVEDTGIGMDEETLERVFEPYARAKENGEEGTGLGLCVARQLAERMGGTLTAQSTSGKGSRFVLRVPLEDAGQPQKAARKMHEGRRILIAEDNEQLRLMLTELCGLCGAEVFAVSDGGEAVSAVLSRQETYFSVLLLDEHMPGLTGSEAAACIRESGYHQLPMIALTGEPGQLKDPALFSGILEKPVELPRLWGCLDRWIQ